MRATDFLYLGLGAAFLAKEKVEEQLREFMEQGKISKEEARKFMDEVKDRGEKERKELEERIRKVVKEAVTEMGLATREDIDKLRKELKKKA